MPTNKCYFTIPCMQANKYYILSPYPKRGGLVKGSDPKNKDDMYRDKEIIEFGCTLMNL